MILMYSIIQLGIKQWNKQIKNLKGSLTRNTKHELNVYALMQAGRCPLPLQSAEAAAQGWQGREEQEV